MGKPSTVAVQADPATSAPSPRRWKRKKSPRRLTVQTANMAHEQASAAALDRLRNRIHRITPSATWRDDLYGKVVRGEVPNVTKIEKELNRKQEFPPGGANDTLMRVCPKCGGKWYPPQYLVSDRRVVKSEICTDCLEIGRAPKDESERSNVRDGHAELADGGTTSSPVAVALEELKARGGAIEETPLETENVAVLKAQIARYLAGKPTTLLHPFSGEENAWT